MNNFDTLLRVIVPLSFLAIWAITSLLNRETKPIPARRPMPDRPIGPRPGEPTLRWGPANASAPRDPWRNANVLGREDDIVIISPDDAPAARPSRARPAPTSGTRRTARTRPNLGRTRKAEAPAAQPLLGGVIQGVNQQLATTVGMTPLSGADQNVSGSASKISVEQSGSSRMITASMLAPLMADHARLREAFLMNELLGPPLALRSRRSR